MTDDEIANVLALNFFVARLWAQAGLHKSDSLPPGTSYDPELVTREHWCNLLRKASPAAREWLEQQAREARQDLPRLLQVLLGGEPGENCTDARLTCRD